MLICVCHVEVSNDSKYEYFSKGGSNMNLFELILGISGILFALIILFPLRKTVRDKFVYWGIVLCASATVLHGEGFTFTYREPVLIGALVLGLIAILLGYLFPWEKITKEVKKDKQAEVETETKNDIIKDVKLSFPNKIQ